MKLPARPSMLMAEQYLIDAFTGRLAKEVKGLQ